MGLIHWWPLNGDAEDKIGGKNGTLYNGAVVTEKGKIGKCYSSTNNSSDKASCSDGISVPNFNLVGEVGSEYSFACWFKVHGTHGQYQSCIMSSGDWNSGVCWVIGFDKDNTKIFCPVDHYNKGEISLGYQLTNNVWYHLATVYKDGVSTAYLNGEAVGSVQRTGIYRSTTESSYIGRDDAHSGFFPYNGDISDLRIYDHALSKKEVKELSKGLVVHYSFDDVLAESTTNIDPCKDSLITHSYPGASLGAISCNYGTFHGFDCVEMHLNASYSSDVWIYMNSNPISQGAKVGDTVTRSCWMYIPSGQTKPPHFTESIEGNSRNIAFVQYDYNKCDTWQRVSMTGTIADTGTNNYLHYFMAGSGTVNFKWYIRDFQMEIKDHATPYTPNSRGSMLVNEAGYGENATTVNTNLTTDTHSGNYSMKFTGSGTSTQSYIDLGDITIDTNYMTFCVWCKWNSLQNWSRIFDFGKGTEGQDTDILLANNGTSSSLYLAGRTSGGGSFPDTSVGTISTGVWYFIAASINNQTANVYIYKSDGTLQTKSFSINNLGDSETFVNCYLGKSNWSGDSYFDGQIADFKLYASALNEAEIKRLFEIGLSAMPNHGAFATVPFTERKSAFSSTKKGVETVNLIEPATKTLSDGSNWVCIFNHDLRDDATWFANSTEAGICTNKENRYSLLNYIGEFISTDNKYEFLLAYPEKGTIEDGFYNRWTQTSNPNTTTGSVSGFTAVSTKWSNYNKGLAKGGTAYMNTNAGGGTWYGAIGQYGMWTSTQYIPAADTSSVQATQLWIRYDNAKTKYKGYFKIYNNGSLLSSKVKED